MENETSKKLIKNIFTEQIESETNKMKSIKKIKKYFFTLNLNFKFFSKSSFIFPNFYLFFISMNYSTSSQSFTRLQADFKAVNKEKNSIKIAEKTFLHFLHLSASNFYDKYSVKSTLSFIWHRTYWMSRWHMKGNFKKNEIEKFLELKKLLENFSDVRKTISIDILRSK